MKQLTLMAAIVFLPTIVMADVTDNMNVKQPFTGLYAQVGAGIESFSMSSTMTISDEFASAFPNDPSITHRYSQTGPSGELGAGYRFAIKNNLLMGVGVMGEMSRYKATQSFDFTTPYGNDYNVISALTPSYSVTPFLELAYAGSKNLVSVFSGPSITQMTLKTDDFFNGVNQNPGATNSMTKTGLSFGGSLEHRLTPSLGIFLRGMYTVLPKFSLDDTQSSAEMPSAIGTITSDNPHVYTAQVGLEVAFG